jgi:hypothetical protein
MPDFCVQYCGRSVHRAGFSRMQSSSDVTADQATTERTNVLVPLGFTERQARFLATVMLHSGVFVGRQYAAFAATSHTGRGCDAVRSWASSGLTSTSRNDS